MEATTYMTKHKSTIATERQLEDLLLRKTVKMLWGIRDAHVEDGATQPVIESLALLADISIERASEAVDSYYEEEIG